MLKIAIETELKSVNICIPSYNPQSPLEALIIEIRHVLVGMGYYNKHVDTLLSLSNDMDDEFENNPDDNAPNTTKN
jgi:hypothetical protein